MRLTATERKVLEYLAEDPTHELTQAVPGGWYYGNTRVQGKVGWSLLAKMLLREDAYSTPGYTIYTINDLGREALKNE